MQCLNCKIEMVNYDVTMKRGMRERAELFVQQLDAHRYSQLSYDTCEQCGSLWLDAGELDKLAFKVEGSIEFCSQEEDKTRRPTRKCPRCIEVDLAPVKFLDLTDINLDRCHNCGGFWLDGGELNLVNRELAKIMPVSGHGFSDFVNNVHVPFWFKRIKRPSSETDFEVVAAPIPGARHKGTTDRKCPADGAALDSYRLSRVKFEGCPTCHGMWLDKDELRQLKNKFNDGQLHWINREVNDIEKASMISSSRVCPKCPSSKLRSVLFGHSGVVIDSCPDCQGIWLDRREYDSICEYLHSKATSATAKEIREELAHDLKKTVTGEDPESRLAELGDIYAAHEALANLYVFDHPALGSLLTGVAQSGRSIGM
jgi:Zn-finger nucleic acid-binding protein